MFEAQPILTALAVGIGHAGCFRDELRSNAQVYVDKRDPDYWLNTVAAESAAPEAKTTFTQSYQTVHPYVASGQLRPFDGATTPFPGVPAMPEHGHKPALTGYMIDS
jgi:hypothetical protein